MRSCRITRLFIFIAVVHVLFVSVSTARAQDKTAFNADLQSALQLVRANRMQDALPALEKLYASDPEHPIVLEALGYALATAALPDTKDLENRKRTLVRARQLIEKAQKLGNNSGIVQVLLANIPPDGDVPVQNGNATNPQAQDAMLAGEAAFSKGDFQGAIQNYERALKLEPTLYEAPLFIGDAYFKMGKPDLAGENYAKAIAIDPDRDTAYRYWGDVLLRANQFPQAKEKFIEAVIAEPYSRDTWQFLGQWAQRAGIQLAHPRIDVPKPSINGEPDRELNLVIPAGSKDKKDGSDAWIGYSIIRVGWRADEKLFKDAYPNETKYRHSLKEEILSLHSVIEVVQGQLKDGKLKEADLDVSIANLLKVHKAGLLEAFVLLAMPDEGIAQDYLEYRKDNRPKLRQYLTDFVTSGR